MSKKPLCKCGHNATMHANVKYNNKKGEAKHYTKCRNKECTCKAYQKPEEKEIIETQTPTG